MRCSRERTLTDFLICERRKASCAVSKRVGCAKVLSVKKQTCHSTTHAKKLTLLGVEKNSVKGETSSAVGCEATSAATCGFAAESAESLASAALRTALDARPEPPLAAANCEVPLPADTHQQWRQRCSAHLLRRTLPPAPSSAGRHTTKIQTAVRQPKNMWTKAAWPTVPLRLF